MVKVSQDTFRLLQNARSGLTKMMWHEKTAIKRIIKRLTYIETSVLFLKTVTASIEFGQNSPGGEVRLRHENDLIKFAEYASTMWGVTFSLTTTDDYYISSVLSTCECRVDLRFLAGSPMPADIYYCEDHQFYNPQEFKSSGPSLSFMASDVAIYPAENHKAEVDIRWNFTMTKLSSSPKYVSERQTTDSLDLLSEMNLKRMEILQVSATGGTTEQSSFTADLMLASGRDAIGGVLLPTDRKAVQTFVEFCVNNEVFLPLTCDEHGRKRLEAKDKTELLTCLDDIAINMLLMLEQDTVASPTSPTRTRPTY